MGACFSSQSVDKVYEQRLARTTEVVAPRQQTQEKEVPKRDSRTTVAVTVKSDRVLRLLEALSGVLDVEYASLMAISVDGSNSINQLYRKNNQKLPGVRTIAMHLSSDIVTINDTMTDARYWQHPLVQRHPNLRFFCSIPLKLTTGVWLGHICVADKRIMQLTDDQLMRLKRLTDYATQLVQQELSGSNPHKSPDESYNSFFLCDASCEGWPILFSNETWELNTKVYKGSKIWGTFTTSTPLEDVLNKDTAVQLTSAAGEHILVNFEHLVTKAYKGFWTDATCNLVLWGKCNLLSPGQDVPKPPWNNMILGRLLGKGSFGVVYFASWHSRIVAVKLLANEASVPQEALLGLKLQHSYVLQTFEYRAVDKQIWIIVEYCDMGALLRHIDAGLYANSTLDKAGAIVQLLLQIALGMQYLHEHNILHGDLSTNNVLLTADGQAKVADFGMSRAMAVSTIATNSFGTVSYMPPELLSKGLLSKAADVYSYGVIMYEVVTSKRAYAGLSSQQIFAVKLYPSDDETYKLGLPAESPDVLKDIFQGCQQEQYHERPSFSDIVQKLQNW
jgi:hypothetical protein